MLIDPAQLLIFYPAVLALNLTPGNDMLFCLGQGIRSGPKAGFAASLGISLGSMIHTLLAAFGLAALLAAHPVMFEVIRWGGILYMVWLGIQTFRHFEPANMVVSGAKIPVLHVLREGVIVNLFNPKVAIFILAFIPQFIEPERGSTLIQFMIYGMIFIANGTLVNAVVGMSAGRFRQLLQSSPRFVTGFRYVSALIFFALAARMAFDRG